MTKIKQWEDSYLSDMEDISLIQTAHLTAQKMFRAIELNDISAFKRLHGLDAE
ncbi:MAG: hypothetical protein PHD33_06455 [Atribacterota bacterium]|nr:hypothetical protein [Atribacterota bacterium]